MEDPAGDGAVVLLCGTRLNVPILAKLPTDKGIVPTQVRYLAKGTGAQNGADLCVAFFTLLFFWGCHTPCTVPQISQRTAREHGTPGKQVNKQSVGR